MLLLLSSATDDDAAAADDAIEPQWHSHCDIHGGQSMQGRRGISPFTSTPLDAIQSVHEDIYIINSKSRPCAGELSHQRMFVVFKAERNNLILPNRAESNDRVIKNLSQSR